MFRKKKGWLSLGENVAVGVTTPSGTKTYDQGANQEATTGTEQDNAKTSTPVLRITSDESEGGRTGGKRGEKVNRGTSQLFSASGDTPLSCIEPLTGPFSEDKPYVIAYADLVNLLIYLGC